MNSPKKSKSDQNLDMPKNLPPLPPVPEGYHRWEYKGTGYRSKACVYAHVDASRKSWSVWGNEMPAGCCEHHYIVAVRDPKPAPVIRKSRKTAAPKKRRGRVVAKRAWCRGVWWRLYKTKKHADSYNAMTPRRTIPVAILYVDAASVERMVEQDARAMMKLLGSWEDTTESHRNQMRALARAALASKGIKAKGGRHG